jgi:hypothetical protein
VTHVMDDENDKFRDAVTAHTGVAKADQTIENINSTICGQIPVGIQQTLIIDTL